MELNAGHHEHDREIRYADKEDHVKPRRPVPPCSLIFPYTRTATPVAHCVSPRLGAGAAAKATRHFIGSSDSLLVCVHQFLSVMTITAPLPVRLRGAPLPVFLLQSNKLPELYAHRIAAAIPYCRCEPFARFPEKCRARHTPA